MGNVRKLSACGVVYEFGRHVHDDQKNSLYVDWTRFGRLVCVPSRNRFRFRGARNGSDILSALRTQNG
jgi:hypothetical protein